MMLLIAISASQLSTVATHDSLKFWLKKNHILKPFKGLGVEEDFNLHHEPLSLFKMCHMTLKPI